jgi:hypothetical protein
MIQNLMDFLKNHLSIGAPGPHRGLPPGAGAPDRAAGVASHRLKHHLNRFPVPERVLVPSAAWVLVPSAAWVLVTFRLHQRVYLRRYLKELMLRNYV